jgi:acyl carrier protein
MAKKIKSKTKIKTAGAKPSLNVLSRIQKIIAGQLKIKPGQIEPRAVLEKDLDADSLDALEIIFQLEEAFNIKIMEDEARKMVTVQDIVDLVTSKVAK